MYRGFMGPVGTAASQPPSKASCKHKQTSMLSVPSWPQGFVRYSVCCLVGFYGCSSLSPRSSERIWKAPVLCKLHRFLKTSSYRTLIRTFEFSKTSLWNERLYSSFMESHTWVGYLCWGQGPEQQVCALLAGKCAGMASFRCKSDWTEEGWES